MACLEQLANCDSKKPILTTYGGSCLADVEVRSFLRSRPAQVCVSHVYVDICAQCHAGTQEGTQLQHILALCTKKSHALTHSSASAGGASCLRPVPV